VGKVHHVHDPQHQGEASSEQEQHEPELQPVQELLQD